jgi:acyl dehydratase
VNAATYFEDVQVGDEELTPGMTLTQTHAALYSGLTGDAPDEPDAIPDLLPICLQTGLGWRGLRRPLAVLAFMSIDWKIHRAARVGDTIHGRARAVSKRPMREGGVLIEHHEIVDQHGDVLQSGRFVFLVARRAAAGTPIAETPAR